MLYPSYEDVKKLSAEFHTIPVSYTFSADHCSPLSMYMALAEGQDNAVLLEGDFIDEEKRCIAAAACPDLILRIRDNKVTYGIGNEWIGTAPQEAWKFIREFLAANNSPQLHAFFTGGFVGLFPDKDGNNGDLLLYNELAVYDTQQEKITVIVHLHAGTDLHAQYQAAEIRTAELAAKIDRYHCRPQYWDDKPPITAALSFTLTDFMASYYKCKRVEVENAPDSFEVYRRLRHEAVSGSCAYLKMGDYQLLGVFTDKTVSPEGAVGFLSFSGGQDTRLITCAAVYERDRAVISAGAMQSDRVPLPALPAASADNAQMMLRAMENARR